MAKRRAHVWVEQYWCCQGEGTTAIRCDACGHFKADAVPNQRPEFCEGVYTYGTYVSPKVAAASAREADLRRRGLAKLTMPERRAILGPRFSMLVLMALLLAACTHGGPVGSTLICTDYPADAPVASRCE